MLGIASSHTTITTSDGGMLALHSFSAEQDDLDSESRVVVVGGAFLTAAIYQPFCIALAHQLGQGWAVDVYDRRGRGGSSEQPEDYSMDTEIGDLVQVVHHTGATHVMGHSLGGAVVLNTALEQPLEKFNPEKLCVYDPAINIDGSADTSWLPHFKELVDSAHYNRALKLVHQQIHPMGSFRKVPAWLLTGLVAITRPTKLGRLARTLLPTGVGELRAALEKEHTAQDFAVLPSNTHFMAGAMSADYFQDTARRLHAAVPGSTLEYSPSVHGSIPFMHPEVLKDMSAYFKGSSTRS